jgi:8-oxo-dGTP pyrophosphatase MutT (NUDIX family)
VSADSRALRERERARVRAVVARLTEATLRERLKRALAHRPARKIPLGTTTAAAVLLPLFERDGEARVWLVRRPTTMRSHAGQVAFPGGKSDAADESLLDTALREADEELAIPRARVEVLGALDDTLTITGYVISPFVGWIPHDVEPRPNPSEVARAFSAPLGAFFVPPSGVLPWRGWTIEGELVWGATAAIVRGFVGILRELGLDDQ